MIIKTVCTILTVVFEVTRAGGWARGRGVYNTTLAQLCGVYDEGSFDPKRGYLYIAAITNFSQVVRFDFSVLRLLWCAASSHAGFVQWAMYCLILFYVELRASMAALKPVGKIVSIKSVVFFTFWCGHLI